MSKRVKPLLFSTKNAHYFYDDSTQIVLPITKEEYIFIKDDKFCSMSDETIKERSSHLYQMIKAYNLLNYRTEENENDVEYSLKTHGIKSLILSVHDSCNMRCKYCYFSDKYEYTPTYKNNSMSFEIAKKAVDFYIDFNEKAVASNPNLKYVIGFYGGEPLLNWEVICKVVDYCKQKYKALFEEMVFPITTNGLLLDEQRITYMLENHFVISVSFDGNQQEHDRNRIDMKGSGTFNTVFNNLQLLEKKYKEYDLKKTGKYRGYYNILLTYDNKTNLIELNEFFKKNSWIDRKIFHINRVSPLNTTYYEDQQTEKDKERFYQQQEELINLFKTTPQEQRTKFLKTYIKQMFLLLIIRNNYSDNMLRGSCIPGEGKLHVDSEGKFHICEKINRLYPIGNIEEGFNIDNQNRILNMFLEMVNTTCKNCNVRNLCSLCYATTQNDGSCFKIEEKMCNAIRENCIRTLKQYYEFLEENISILEE